MDEQTQLKLILIRKEKRIQRANDLLLAFRGKVILDNSLEEETREWLLEEIHTILPYLENDDKEENKYNYDNANGYKLEQSNLHLRQMIRRKAKRIERVNPLLNTLRAKVVLDDYLTPKTSQWLLDEISTILPYLKNDDKEENKYNLV